MFIINDSGSQNREVVFSLLVSFFLYLEIFLISIHFAINVSQCGI